MKIITKTENKNVKFQATKHTHTHTYKTQKLNKIYAQTTLYVVQSYPETSYTKTQQKKRM